MSRIISRIGSAQIRNALRPRAEFTLVQPAFCQAPDIFNVVRHARQRVIHMLFRPPIELHIAGGMLKLFVSILQRLVQNVVRKWAKTIGVLSTRLVMMGLGIQPSHRPMIRSEEHTSELQSPMYLL